MCVRQALFAFATHTSRRFGATLFYMQYGVEPTLPFTSIIDLPITRVELAEAAEFRKNQVQDLSKYRTEAAKRYQTALKRLAAARDEMAFDSPIVPGDLIMREPLNRKSKLHPAWDGPFVVLESSESDAYQLSTANGHVLQNLVNGSRLRKLNLEERKRYVGEFWEASKRLRSQDERARQDRELRDIDMRLRKATLDNLEAQKRGERVTLDQHAQITKDRQAKIAEIQPETSKSSNANTTRLEAETLPRRIRRLPSRYRD